MKQKYQPLFEPLVFNNGITARNRVVVAPMTHYSSNEDGSSIPDEFPYIERRSAGPGVVITACYAITENGKAYVGEPFITDDKFIPDLRKLASVIKDKGAVAILQLHHGGSVCPPELVPEGDVVAPSAVAIPERSYICPRELTPFEIEQLIIEFGQATRRAIEAGFDGVELHGAYGYMLQQFISPYCNLRTDEWGGSREKRFAFPVAVINEVKRIRDLYPKKPFLIGYRFSPEEALNPGLTMADALVFTETLVSQELDFIDVLVNDYRSSPRAGLEDLTGNRLTLIAEKIAGRTVLLGGGSIFTADEGLEAYQKGLDMITLAREMIIDPEWVQKIEMGEEDKINTTLQPEDREKLQIPEPFWKVIWYARGWFPGTT